MKLTLKAARVNKGLTLEEASKKMSVTAATISNWERKKTFPDVMQLKKIEEAYEISYNDLIFLG